MATIWTGAMMLDHLGETAAAARIMAALEATTAAGFGTVPDKDRTDLITAEVLRRIGD